MFPVYPSLSFIIQYQYQYLGTSNSMSATVEKTVKLIKKGNTDKFSDLMQEDSFDINEIDTKSGRTFLQVAIQSDSRDIVQLLVRNKHINLQIRSKSGQTALESAILMNNLEYVEWILRAKVNQKSKNEMGYSAMGTAIKNKTNPQIVSKLLFHGFDVNQNVPTFGCLLNLAINCNQFQNFQVLLKNPKLDIKIQDQNENTCLMVCVMEKKGEYVQAILERLQKIEKEMNQFQRQFFINATDQNGDTVLHIAAKKDYQAILDLLVKKGPPLGLQLDAKNKQGKTFQEIRDEVEKEREKQKHRQQFNQRRRIEEKKIKQKEKQEEKAKTAMEQQALRIAEKKRKREEQLLESQRIQLQKQMENKRKVWIFGISIIVLFGIVYLVFLSAMKKKPGHGQQF